MSHRLAPAMLTVALLAFATAAHAQKTITVNFDSEDAFKESSGAEGKAKKSTMTKEQRAAAIAVAQKEYDDAVGKGVVTVKEGTGGDVEMTVSGDTAIKKGAKYGNAGQEGKTGIVYQGEFEGFKDAELSNAIGETVAHEAGHKLGLDHNSDNPVSKMTSGDLVTEEQRKKDGRAFNADDIKKLKKNLGLNKAEQKDDRKTGDLGVRVGNVVAALQNKPDDDYLDAFVDFDAVGGTEFGYITSGGDFVFQGDDTDDPYPGFLTFIYSAGANLAVSFGGQILSLQNGGGQFLLSNPNPFNPKVYRHAELLFETPGGTALLTLDATVRDGTGGFYAIPEPAAWSLMILGFGLLGATLRRRLAPA